MRAFARRLAFRMAAGQFDPIWMLVILGAAIVLALLFWRDILPPAQTMIKSTGCQINNLNAMMGSTGTPTSCP